LASKLEDFYKPHKMRKYQSVALSTEPRRLILGVARESNIIVAVCNQKGFIQPLKEKVCWNGL